MPMSISSAARRSSPSSSSSITGSAASVRSSKPLDFGGSSFTLNTAAYQAEILRGAIESVPRGQREGAAALGLPERVAFFKVILPQAMIVALRPYGNEIILMIKGSAIVAIVTVFDLMGETRRAFSRTFDYQMYIWAAILYLLMVELLRNIWGWLEARLTRHLKR
jgi:polar amino acid transport system permease protein